jgi:tripartite-type tricarboxylate transporter receptor subunit TctC
VLVGFAAGGGTDITARIVADRLSQRLNQSFFVENKPGGSGNISSQALIASAPDGYTLMVGTASNAINVTFYGSLPFNFLADTSPISGLVSYPLVFVVGESFPAATVAEFIAYVKANPGKVNMASFGTGTTGHLSSELFKMMAGLDMPHVPYKGEAPALADIMAGHVQMMFATPPGAVGLLKAKQVRALAVTSARRWEGMPELASIGDTVSGYDASSWSGLVGPKGMPPETVALLNHEVTGVLSDPGIKTRFAELGTTPLVISPAEFGAFMAAEVEKWGKVVRALGIKAD